VLRGHQGQVNAVALGRAGEGDIVAFCSGDIVHVVDLIGDRLTPGRLLMLGPGPGTLLDLRPDHDGSYRLARISDDAWRHWRAQGIAAGRLVTMPIDDMPRVQ